MKDLIQRGTAPAEFRADGDQAIRLVGHAAVFNARSEDFGGWVETIAPGAFRDALQTDVVKALWNHNTDWVIGSNRSGTLRLAEDERGLAIEADPPDTQWMRDHIVTIRRGDVDQMSFGFWVNDEGSPGDTWHREGDLIVRTLTRVHLFDVSPVAFPAYRQTDVKVRSAILERAQRALDQGTAPAGRDRDWYVRRLRAIRAAEVTA